MRGCDATNSEVLDCIFVGIERDWKVSSTCVAYYAYIHGLANKWTYFLQTIPNISDLLQPLEDAIFHHFIPALVGKSISDVERALFTLPGRLGGLGISNPQELSD